MINMMDNIIKKQYKKRVWEEILLFLSKQELGHFPVLFFLYKLGSLFYNWSWGTTTAHMCTYLGRKIK